MECTQQKRVLFALLVDSVRTVITTESPYPCIRRHELPLSTVRIVTADSRRRASDHVPQHRRHLTASTTADGDTSWADELAEKLCVHLFDRFEGFRTKVSQTGATRI